MVAHIFGCQRRGAGSLVARSTHPRATHPGRRPRSARATAAAHAMAAATVALSTSLALSACGGLAADGPAQSGPTGESPERDPDGLDPERDGDAARPDAEGGASESLLDRNLSAMLDDLRGIDAEQRRFMRYVTLAHVRNSFDDRSDRANTAASDIEGARDVRRLAVTKLVNSVSRASGIARPMSIGRERTYQRIDIRDYGWELPSSVLGRRYPDGWEAIVAGAAQPVVFAGPAADRLRELSRTDVPWLLADDFVATVASGDVYYELMGAADTLQGLQMQLAQTLGDPLLEVYRAGSTFSALSFSPRVVERRGGRESGLWQALDFADAERGLAIFTDPLSVVPDATEVIFSLPNGLRGYFVADATGRRTAVSPLPTSVISDPSQPDGVMRNAASCFNCHNGGLIPFRDEVRERSASLPPDQQASALALFPEPGVLESLANGDDDRYFRALAAADVSAQMEDPISRVHRGFWDELGPQQAAGELFVEPRVLAGEASRLGGALPALAAPSTRIPRTEFATYYVEALCRLHRASENRPAGC